MTDFLLSFAETGLKLSQGLEEFYNQVSQGKASELVNLYTMDTIITAFIAAIGNANREQYIQIAYAMVAFLDAYPAAVNSVAKSDIPKLLMALYGNCQFYELILNILSRCYSIRQFYVDREDLRGFVEAVPDFSKENIIPSVQFLTQILKTGTILDLKVSRILRKIPYVGGEIRESLIYLYATILKYGYSFDNSLLLRSAEFAFTTNYSETCTFLLEFITRLLRGSRKMLQEIDGSGYQFYKLPFKDNFQGNMDILSLSMKICIYLLIDEDIPTKYLPIREPKFFFISTKMIDDGYFSIQTLYYEYPHNTAVTAAYALISKYRKPYPCYELFDAMHRSLSNKLNLPYILYISSIIDNMKLLEQNGIIEKLYSPEYLKDKWYSIKLKLLAKPELNIFELLDAIGSRVFSKDMLMNGVFKSLLLLLKQYQRIEDLDLNPTIQVALDVLNVIKFEREKGIHDKDNLSNCMVRVKCSGMSFNVDFKVTMAHIEGLLNKEFNPKCVDDLRKEMNKKQSLQSALNYYDYDLKDRRLNPAKFALFSRIFENPSYKKCYFMYNGYYFNIDDCLSTVVATGNPQLIDINKQTIELEVFEGDSPRTNFPIPPVNLSGPILDVLEFLAYVHEKCPNLDVTGSYFARNTINMIDSPLEIVLRKSSAVSFVYTYPFLFNFQQRMYVARTVMATPYDTIKALEEQDHWNRLDNMDGPRHSVKVDRAKIFEHGSIVLKYVTRSAIRMSVTYKNEKGIGPGPTKEFFQLMSAELVKNKRKMWLSSDYETEFASRTNGLFPRPDSNPEDFFLFGVLASKALQEKILIDFEISSAFMKMVFGKKITMHDVDETIARALEDPDGLIGLDFTYPGLPDVVMTDKYDEVTKENVSEYIELIKKFTIDKVEEHVNQFRLGFSQNAELLSAMIFEPEEFSRALCGDKVLFTEGDMKRNIISVFDSKYVSWFIKIVCSFTPEEQRLLCRFITGSERLPPGGLSGLKTRIAIELIAVGDQKLPKAHVCFNRIDLPMYSSEQIMRERILTAIKWADTFELV